MERAVSQFLCCKVCRVRKFAKDPHFCVPLRESGTCEVCGLAITKDVPGYTMPGEVPKEEKEP